MKNGGLSLKLVKPTAPLTKFVQSFWSVSVRHEIPIAKPLYADACSGIIFKLQGEAFLGERALPNGVIMLPVKSSAETITLSHDALLAGIRFRPGAGLGVMGQHFAQPTVITDALPIDLKWVYQSLLQQSTCSDRIEVLKMWTNRYLSVQKGMPATLRKALTAIEQANMLAAVESNSQLSQRQIERQCKHWLGITPKHYQRILRTKETIHFLKQGSKHTLSDVAYQFGYSDQAHMTREFRAFASTTPSKICSKVNDLTKIR